MLVMLVSLASVSHAKSLILGSKNFTEQHILSAMTVQYLEHNGFRLDARTDLATIILREALINQQIDFYWEYTGTSLIIFNHVTDKVSDEEAYHIVKTLDAKRDLVWLTPAKMNNTYAIAMRRDLAEKYAILTVSDFATFINKQHQQGAKQWQLGFDIEFVGRSDGLAPMLDMYQFRLNRPQIRQMEAGLVYNAIRDDFVKAGLVYTTDGRINGFDLKVLEDDRHYFPSYNVAPVIRKEVLAKYPELEPLLNRLIPYLTNETISRLNAQVDIEHKSINEVANGFLKENGLL